MNRRQLNAEIDRLYDSNARMLAQLGRTEAKWAVSQCIAADLLDDLEAARDELRRLRGELTAVDRAMPGPDAA